MLIHNRIDSSAAISASQAENLLHRNNGDGTFKNVTREIGLWKPDGHSISVASADFRNDGWLELLSTNDAMPGARHRDEPRLMTKTARISRTGPGSGLSTVTAGSTSKPTCAIAAPHPAPRRYGFDSWTDRGGSALPGGNTRAGPPLSRSSQPWRP
jgi:hypothetical protein